jgi:5'-phosphate synthase pdxT subunit
VKIGILALQGDVREHSSALEAAGATPVTVKTQEQLSSVDALVLPGGESTTIGKLLDRFGLMEPVRRCAREGMPVFGTCAGLILMAEAVVGREGAPDRLGILDVTVRRNAFGRQVDSFETDLEVRGLKTPIRAAFIRAPRIEEVGLEVEVLATLDDEPVLVRQGHLLGSTFHPEITGEDRVHRMFVEMVG